MEEETPTTFANHGPKCPCTHCQKDRESRKVGERLARVLKQQAEDSEELRRLKESQNPQDERFAQEWQGSEPDVKPVARYVERPNKTWNQ